MIDLLLLFLASFLAATLVPAQSEAVLAALHLAGNHHAVSLVFVVTIGNVLGACINWLLGRYILRFQDRAWFPIKVSSLNKAANFYQRYGRWSLLLAWVPFIGDSITVIAGVLRTPFVWFLILVTIGKLARYVAVVLLF